MDLLSKKAVEHNRNPYRKNLFFRRRFPFMSDDRQLGGFRAGLGNMLAGFGPLDYGGGASFELVCLNVARCDKFREALRHLVMAFVPVDDRKSDP